MNVKRAGKGGWTGRRFRLPKYDERIVELLKLLNVDASIRKGKPCESLHCPRRTQSCVRLWRRTERQILDIFHTARANYLAAVKELHPDRPGGDTQKMATLNTAWQQIVKVFGKRGYHLDAPQHRHD